MPNQLAITGAPDVYSQASRKLLQLLPASCLTAERMFLDSLRTPEVQKAATTYSEDSSPPPPPLLTSSPHPHNHLEKPTPIRAGKHVGGPAQSSNPFDQSVPSRSRSGSEASSSSLVSMTSSSSATQTSSATSTVMTTSVAPNSSVVQSNEKDSFAFEYISPEVAYMNNLEAARVSIHTCASRCRCWSSLYDKCELSKAAGLKELLDNGMKRSLEMEDVQKVRVCVTGEGDREEGFATGGGRFRSRATTVSAHSRLARTASARGRSRLRPDARREEAALSDDASEQGGVRSSSRIRSGAGSSSPKTSPRFGRKFSDSGRFDDKVGSLLKVLLEKLTDMLELPPVVNVLLTRVVSRLAQYPQPLLRSLLLNHQLVLRPGVPNLFLVRKGGWEACSF